MENDWRIYNHCLISNKMPHEEKKELEIENLEKWKDKRTLLARWTSDFDCGYETEWWYCLKDDKFNISTLKSKRRYVVKKGIENFNIKIIDKSLYFDEMYDVYRDSLEEYPKKYRIIRKKEDFIKFYSKLKSNIYIGVWDKETGEFAGYLICSKTQNQKDIILNLQTVKVKKSAQKKEVNAAIVNFVCCKFLNNEGVKYICDGERNIRHITNYQEYLIKYFGFKKVYCKLNIKYKPMMKLAVNILYPFRKILKNTNNKMLYNIYCILIQEEIRRSFKK